ncbi:inositol 1,4,5-trisphosphate receptor-interacting protein-like 1 [Cyrtonyx montezumae]|uniref:inositol 1,4,5-trisphosphate receptor-interacting protein-like 1 n=1 Tax=Cyrtonyx montezumae TaxID=9017 RepID=UPI0032DA4AC8
MVALVFIFTLLAQTLPLAGNDFNEHTFRHMKQHELYLREQMTVLLKEVEQINQNHSRMGMQALLSAVLFFWKTVSLCVFGLLFWPMWKIRKKFWEDQDNSDEVSCSSEEECQEEQELEKEVEEQQEELEDQEEKKQQEHTEMEELEQKEEAVLSLAAVPSHQEHGEMILSMLCELIKCSQFVIANTFYPVPEHPIVVGSTYEGWGLPEEEPIFCLLVPFKAPRGHIFHLDLGTTRQLPVKNSCIHVEWECTCGQEMGMLCFLRTSEDELRNQSPSLLDTLCTGSYLDVWKTACWFETLCMTSWKYLPESSVYSLNVTLLFKRSCRLRLTDVFRRTFLIEIMLGVQQDNTDIFLSSQETEAPYMPSTSWLQTCAVAEAKFFRYITARAGEDNLYLRYMRVCAYVLVGYNFSPYELKTVLMNLQTAIPMECWSWKNFVLRMEDIFHYLCCCLEQKCLDHFLVGNEAVPAEFILPWEFRESRPPNLFQHLVQDPDRHEQVLYEMEMLQDRFTTLLIYRKRQTSTCPTAEHIGHGEDAAQYEEGVAVEC